VWAVRQEAPEAGLVIRGGGLTTDADDNLGFAAFALVHVARPDSDAIVKKVTVLATPHFAGAGNADWSECHIVRP
jgi:hypothetical protein